MSERSKAYFGVRSIWNRHDLEHFKKRLKGLEKQVAEENLILRKLRCKRWKKREWKLKRKEKLNLTLLAI